MSLIRLLGGLAGVPAKRPVVRMSVAAALGLAVSLEAQTEPAPAPATQPATSEVATTRAVATQPTRPAPEPATRPVGIGGMDLDQLMELEVTTVSRRPQRWSESASAVQVLSGEDIRRSAATNLPEALRLAPNLQVAQINAKDFAVTSRGFNGASGAGTTQLSNKLLVMIDGRTVYTPLFGGVFWDAQHVLMEDIDRLEVVSGPGGTLWGANAVNGVINVITKSAQETQGLYLSQTFGTWWQNRSSVRYGGQLGEDLYFRIYGVGLSHDDSKLITGGDANDQWRMGQTGFRVDYLPGTQNTLTVQGDLYRQGAGDEPSISDASGGNVLTRWRHAFDDESDMTLQMYFDVAGRDFRTAGLNDDQRTFDVDFQHRFPLAERHAIVWGWHYRIVRDETSSTGALSFDPATRQLDLASAFIQDEITLVPDRWKFTIGSKVEYNEYSHTEFSPSARIAWTPDERQTVWAAVSRAVRSPTRLERDLVLATLVPSDFDSEKVLSYELGYRARPVNQWSVSLATFFNQYEDLRSVDTVAPGVFTFANNQEANAWGLELASDFQAAEWWRLRGGYTWMNKSIWQTSAAVLPTAESLEGNDPSSQIVVQSMMDLPRNLQFDVVGRFVSSLAAPEVPSYFTLDVRLAWHYRHAEFAIVGQNLLDNRHPEFGPNEIPRGVYGRLTLRW